MRHSLFMLTTCLFVVLTLLPEWGNAQSADPFAADPDVTVPQERQENSKGRDAHDPFAPESVPTLQFDPVRPFFKDGPYASTRFGSPLGTPGAVRVRNRARVIFEPVREAISQEEIAKARQIRELRINIIAEKDESARRQLAEQLKSMLEEIFDTDVQQENEELAQLEMRLQKLRDKLKKRMAARDRIIGVQIETALLESEGLLFPGPQQQVIPARTSTSTSRLR